MNLFHSNSVYASKFKSLGTEIKIFLVVGETKSKLDAEESIAELKKIYQTKEKKLSRFDPDSELSKLNSHLNVFKKASADIRHLAEKSLEYYEMSQGYFDPRILEVLEDVGYRSDFKKTDFHKHAVKKNRRISERHLKEDFEISGKKIIFRCRMDFSGLAKGYIADEVSSYLIKKGWKSFLIDSGGDIYACGRNENNKPWTVGIEGISEKKMALELENRAAATSGITRRKWEIGGQKYHHLINPLNPYRFSFYLKSVTAADINCEKADVMAKALYLMGREKGIEFSRKNHIQSIFLDYRGNVYLSPEAKKLI